METMDGIIIATDILTRATFALVFWGLYRFLQAWADTQKSYKRTTKIVRKLRERQLELLEDFAASHSKEETAVHIMEAPFDEGLHGANIQPLQRGIENDIASPSVAKKSDESSSGD